ncbi:rRNA maturation RNase YbeY [Candidatus Peregrinibacteria bacterium]|nr:rRNA maturation RNase YbeY [Candidatus Peregrinibacteria bacterium]
MTTTFINEKEWGIDKKIFTPVINRLQEAIEVLDGIINVIFVTDVYIKSLNKSYRDKDEATDVLSFNYQKEMPGDDSNLVGEIYISMDTAKRQAEEYEVPLIDELKKLFVHGFLHIHGYDHESDEDYEIMSKIEEKILA